MSSPQEDNTETHETPPPAGPAAWVSESGPLAPAGQAVWGTDSSLTVRYAGRSAVGLVREHNEDNFVIANLSADPDSTGAVATAAASSADAEISTTSVARTAAVGEGGMLFAVCDGMGGAAAGEVASQMAVDVLQEAMRRGGAPRERDVLARRLVSAVEEAGRRIFESAQRERSRRGMGTTATAAVLIDKVLFLAEVGDSRAYLLRAGELKQVTKDQSLVNQLIEAGHLTEAEAEVFEHSNIILQALGTAETVQVDLTFVELRRGDRLMLCSDGLSGLVPADALRDVLAGIDEPAECTAALVKCAELNGGHDNITVVVVDFDGPDLELPAGGDSFGYLQYPLVPAAGVAGTISQEDEVAPVSRWSSSGYEAIRAYESGGAAAVVVDESPWMWVSAGVTALLLGAWLLAASSGQGSATVDAPSVEARPSPVEPAAAAAADKPDDFAPTQGAVTVRVFSDVRDAVLLVNHELKGPLSVAEEGQPVELPPGQYRFEAQRRGGTVASELVTVQPNTPVDVNLKLPSGTSDPVHPGVNASTGADAGEGAEAPDAVKGDEGEAEGDEPEEQAEPAAPAATPAVKETPHSSPKPAPVGPKPAAAPEPPRSRVNRPAPDVSLSAAARSRPAAPAPQKAAVVKKEPAAAPIPDNPF